MNSATLDFGDVRPAVAQVRRFVDAGAWQTRTIVDDLYRLGASAPGAAAVIARHGDETTRMCWADYVASVDRYAGALRELGVRRGTVVSVWLPSRWQLAALMLAVWKVGGIVAPMMPTIGPRELERMLARVGATVCITTDRYAGVPHARLLAEVGARLPGLAHQVVLGAPGTGQLSFEEVFERREPEDAWPDVDPDRVSTVLFTSGTTGEPKAALHTFNTLGFIGGRYAAGMGLGPADRLFTPHALAHIGGILVSVFMPLKTGACAIILEQWSPGAAAGLTVNEKATFMFAAPVFIEQLLDALPGEHAPWPSLRYIYSGATSIPQALLTEVPRRLGIPLRPLWAMTEAGLIFAHPDDPPSPYADAIGHPAKGLDVKVVHDQGGPVTADTPGHLLVRGAGVCVATVGRDSGEVDVIAERGDGWYDTGDLAVSLGEGGYRLVGRAADRIGGAFMIPVADVEDALRQHPAVADVALVGAPDGHGGEIACAVVTPVGSQAPTLEMLRGFLLGQGMTEWYLPQLLQVIDELPRNATGKVEKKLLRDRLAASQSDERPSGPQAQHEDA